MCLVIIAKVPKKGLLQVLTPQLRGASETCPQMVQLHQWVCASQKAVELQPVNGPLPSATVSPSIKHTISATHSTSMYSCTSVYHLSRLGIRLCMPSCESCELSPSFRPPRLLVHAGCGSSASTFHCFWLFRICTLLSWLLESACNQAGFISADSHAFCSITIAALAGRTLSWKPRSFANLGRRIPVTGTHAHLFCAKNKLISRTCS